MYIVSTVNQEEQYMYTNELKILLHLEVRKKPFCDYHFSDEINKFDTSIKVQS